MYCPHCAAQNIDGAKFCRTCGSDLEIINLALTDPTALRAKEKNQESGKPANKLDKQIEGVHNTIQGVCLLATTVLIGAALAHFLPHDVPWILIWMVFFGWLAVWGAFALAGGLSALVEARLRVRYGEQSAVEIAAANTSELLPPAREMPDITRAAATAEIAPPVSVTERTTDLLSKSLPRDE